MLKFKKNLFKFMLPATVSIIIVLPTLIIQCPVDVKFTIESKVLSFSINKKILSKENREVINITPLENIRFTSLDINELIITDFNHVMLDDYDLFVENSLSHSFKKLESNAKLEVTPIEDRWKRLSNLSLRGLKELIFSVQNIALAHGSTIELMFESDGKLLISIDKGSQLSNHIQNPFIQMTPDGMIEVSFSRSILKLNGNNVDKLYKAFPNSFFVKPSSDFSLITCVGNDGRITFRNEFKEDQFINFSKVEVYDPKSDKWESGFSPVPTPRQNTVAAVIDNKIYVIGGDRKDTSLLLIEDIEGENLIFKSLKDKTKNFENLHVHYLNGERNDLKVSKGLLKLGPNKYSITSISFKRKRLFCLFEGSTIDSILTMGTSNTSLSPTLLEWLYTNQFLATAFGAIAWLAGIIYLIIKEK